MGEENKGEKSKFNEASLKMIRIHEAQSIINRLRINMTGYDREMGKYNYEIAIQEHLSILAEVYGKMSDAEKKIANELENKMTMLLNKLPLKKQRLEQDNMGKRTIGYIDQLSWEILQREIFKLEKFGKEQLEVHGLSSFNQEQEEDWD